MRTTHYACIKGNIGDWTYYVCTMTFKDVGEFVNFAEELVPNPALDDILQRELSDRSGQITQYLISSDQRFMGSLILAVFGGKPTFLPVEFSDNGFLKELDGSIGILKFDGSELYYALDGQHRVAAIKTALAENPTRFANDKVPLIVVRHINDVEGVKRTRRLFTTLNRYAKKTSTNTNIAIDEDDGFAVLTRRFLRENPFFTYRVKISTSSKGKKRLVQSDAIARTDKQYLMALGTFYKGNKSLISPEVSEAFKKPQQLPSFEELESAFSDLSKKWEKLINTVALWKLLRDQDTLLTDYRSGEGGQVLARPIGIISFLAAVGGRKLTPSVVTAIKDYSTKYDDVTKLPWNGLLWNNSSKKMLARKENEVLATRVWKYYLFDEGVYVDLDRDWRAFSDPEDKNPRLHLPRR